MKLSLNTITFLILLIADFFVNVGLGIAAGTCPTPVCTYTAASGTSYTVNSGETICISVNYAAGTITLNGGTVLVKVGGTLDVARISYGATTKTITAATNAFPISCTATGHGYVTGQVVNITGATGETNVNGTYTITVVDANTFTLNSSLGNGTYTASSATVGYVNTISNCGTLTGTWALDSRKVVNNYADNAITVDFNTAGGRLNNYGSPSTATINNWNGASTVDNEGTGVITLVNTAIPAGSTITNNSTAANSFSWTNDLAFNAGSATSTTVITNGKGATMKFNGTGGSTMNNYVTLTNSGTITIASDFTMNAGTNTIINENTGSAMTLSAGKRFTNNGGIVNLAGALTAPNFTLQSAGAVMNLTGGSVLNVSSSFTSSIDNGWNFVNGGTCAYLNLSGTTTAGNTNNNVMTNNTNQNIKYCGPVTTNGVGGFFTISAITNAVPAVVTTTAAHGFVSGQNIIIAGVTPAAYNANWTVKYLTSTTFSIDNVAALGAGTAFGNAQASKLGTVDYIGSSACTAPTCVNGACPTTGCTVTVANNTTSYTVAAGEVLCIPSPINYNSTGVITLNGGIVRIASGATLDVGNGAGGGGASITFGSAAARYIDNCGTLTSSFAGDIDIIAGSSTTNNLTITNYTGSTMQAPSQAVTNTFYNRDFNSIINYGTVTMKGNLYQSGDNSLLSNANSAASMTIGTLGGAAALTIDRGKFKLYGTVTTSNFADDNNASTAITMYDHSTLNVTTGNKNFTTNGANQFFYGGASGSCAFINNPAGGSQNGNGITNSTTQITYCGSGSSARTAAGLGSAIASCTGPTCSYPLPIELLYFDATVKGAYVELLWASSIEINNDYYTVERSVDGINFEVVGTVKGAGNSNGTLKYTLLDTHPFPGISYYRLTQTDFDGRYEHFNIVAVKFNSSLGFVVFPNPSDGNQLYMRFLNPQTGNVTVVIYDILGQAILQSYVKNDLEKPVALLASGQSLARGVYLVKTVCKGDFKTEKLVVE